MLPSGLFDLIYNDYNNNKGAPPIGGSLLSPDRGQAICPRLERLSRILQAPVTTARFGIIQPYNEWGAGTTGDSKTRPRCGDSLHLQQ